MKNKFNIKWLLFVMAAYDLSYQDVADLCCCSKALIGAIIKGDRKVSYLVERGLENIFNLPNGFFRQESVTIRFTKDRIFLRTNSKK